MAPADEGECKEGKKKKGRGDEEVDDAVLKEVGNSLSFLL